MVKRVGYLQLPLDRGGRSQCHKTEVKLSSFLAFFMKFLGRLARHATPFLDQYAIAYSVLALVAAYCLLIEKSLLAFGITSTIFAGLLLILGRLLTASVALAVLVGAIVTISIVKKFVLQVAFHSSDILLIADKNMQSYLWSDQRAYMLGITGSIVLVVLALSSLHRIDATKIPRMKSAMFTAIIAISMIKVAHWRGEYSHFNFTNVNRHLSNFYGSLKETAGLFEKKSYFGISNGAAQAASLRLTPCALPENTPNIILIHEESLFPPSLFKQIEYDRAVDSFFRSTDGRLHQLRVETYGTGSWLTEFSVLAGLSTESFGGVRGMAPAIMTDKLADSLPQWLRHCGFKNIELNPLPEGFAFAGKFHRSIGFDLILDKTRQGAKSFNERDRFYFGNAIAAMREHFNHENTPLFTYIITMASHYPYNYTYSPEENVPGGNAPGVPEMNEYLRRLGLAVRDYRSFVASLKREFPDKRFLLVHYGDHQPIVTGSLIAAVEGVSKSPSESIGYLTYYAVDATNYVPPELPALDVIDVPYLESLVLYLARLPASEATTERLALLSSCGGRYAHCPKREFITAFQNRLFASGVLKVR